MKKLISLAIVAAAASGPLVVKSETKKADPVRRVTVHEVTYKGLKRTYVCFESSPQRGISCLEWKQ